jgi:hypothetical protein
VDRGKLGRRWSPGEEAVRVECQAKIEAVWEAERNGDPDWFEKLLAADGIDLRGLKPRE